MLSEEEENICCQEVDAVKNKKLEAVTVEELQAEPTCIVQHPGFETDCASMYGFSRLLGYSTSNSMALPLMRGLSMRNTATLPTGN